MDGKPSEGEVRVSSVGIAVLDAQLRAGEAWPVALLDRMIDLYVGITVELAKLDRPGITPEEIAAAGIPGAYEEYAGIRGAVELLMMAGAQRGL